MQLLQKCRFPALGDILHRLSNILFRLTIMHQFA